MNNLIILIFQAADTGIDKDLSTIIVGIFLVVATLAASNLVDRTGRKILLLISVIVMTITLTALGVFFYIRDNNPDQARDIGWLPITSLCIYIFAFALGFGPVPWLMLSEVLSKEINPVISPICGAFKWGLAFLITLTFSSISEAIGIGQTFWIFAGISLVGVFFTFFVIPETKGKSLAEIQRMLSGEKQIDQD